MNLLLTNNLFTHVILYNRKQKSAKLIKQNFYPSLVNYRTYLPSRSPAPLMCGPCSLLSITPAMWFYLLPWLGLDDLLQEGGAHGGGRLHVLVESHQWRLVWGRNQSQLLFIFLFQDFQFSTELTHPICSASSHGKILGFEPQQSNVLTPKSLAFPLGNTR